MKAAIRRKYCGPENISVENVDQPTTKDNEVLVQIFASTVNRTDCANLMAKPFVMRFILGVFKPRQNILGTDFAGKIISVGKNISAFKIGERVFGFSDIGIASHAEFAAVNEKHLNIIPENITYKQAASSLEGAHYAYSFVHKVNILPKQKILINGATGAIGNALLQFINEYDVHITASANTKNLELIKNLGADVVYDYSKENFTAKKETYDFIFDAVGKTSYGACKHLLNKKGIYISSEPGNFAQNIFYALLSPLRSKKVIFPIPFSTKKTIPYISNALTAQKFKPIIDREYSLDDISEAFKYVISGRKTGSVIITNS